MNPPQLSQSQVQAQYMANIQARVDAVDIIRPVWEHLILNARRPKLKLLGFHVSTPINGSTHSVPLLKRSLDYQAQFYSSTMKKSPRPRAGLTV